MLAFHSDKKVKQKYLKRVLDHQKADEIIKGAIDSGILKANKNGTVYSSRRKRSLGCLNTHGYVVFTLHFNGSRRQIKAHRAVWIYYNGLPPSGLVVGHINRIKHDNRLCNLRLADAKQNSRNRRSYVGARNPAAKINQSIANKIRDEHKTGWSYMSLATQFGISKTLVANIVRGESWA